MNKIRTKKISELLNISTGRRAIRRYWIVATAAAVDSTLPLNYMSGKTMVDISKNAQTRVLNPDETRVLNPEQQMWNPRSRVDTLETMLKDRDIIPVRYIGGISATEDDEIRSKFGDIFEVRYKNGPAIAKVVSAADPEPSVWKRIIGANISAEARRHLPEIKDIIEINNGNIGGKDLAVGTIIIMEKLGAYSQEVEALLKGKYDTIKDKTKDEEFIHRALVKSMGDSLVSVVRSANEPGEDGADITSFLKFTTREARVVSSLESEIFKGRISLDDIASKSTSTSDNIRSSFSNFLGPKSLVEGFINNYLQSLERYFSSPERPLPKYNKTHAKGIPPNQSYDGQEAEFLYSKEYIPETRSLFSAVMELKNAGILWNDLHANNIMQRIERNSHGDVGDLVIIDVGQYEVE